jgi:ribonuclease P protein component
MQKITRPSQYQAVFQQRRSYTSPSFTVHYMKDTVFRYGIIVSKAVGNSVVRHKKCRQFREIVRKACSEITSLAIVIRVKKTAVAKTFWELFEEFVRVIDKINKEFCL